jgi:hypothetical protein
MTASPAPCEFRSRSPAQAVWRPTTSRRHQHLSEAIRRGPKIPPPAVDQTRPHVGLTRHVSHYRTGSECRRHNRLFLLDAPPATPLRTSQYLDARSSENILPSVNLLTSNRQMAAQYNRQPKFTHNTNL